MELKLKVVEGKNAGQEIAVAGKKFFIGRAEDCHLRPGSDLISRHHCVLLIEDGYVGVRDFGSKNGTYVNDERVVGERELKAGDRLLVGPLRFEVQLGPWSGRQEAAAGRRYQGSGRPNGAGRGPGIRSTSRSGLRPIPIRLPDRPRRIARRSATPTPST